MGIVIPLFNNLSLKIDNGFSGNNKYPTTKLQKGLLLLNQNIDLAEEAVGFGFPVIKRGLITIFPGTATLSYELVNSTCTIKARYCMNLVEKITSGDNEILRGGLFYFLKNILAAVIRHLPIFRALLTSISNRIRRIFNWETTYNSTGIITELEVTYTIEKNTGKVIIEIVSDNLPPDITEVVVMNEQGASSFDTYQDKSGILLHGEQIGCWDRVQGKEASFTSSNQHITFRVAQVPGSQLYRGRELVDTRLNWAGFGYSYPPSIKRFHYDLWIERFA
jgi:hypothetical protein